MTPNDQEADLVRRTVTAVLAGNADAFGALVRQYQRRVFGLALMILRDPATAEEVTQDAFVRAYTHLDAYDTARPFYPWLATIALRLSQNRLVHRGRVAGREVPPPRPDLEDAGAVDPLSALINDEEGRRLWRSVAELPPGERSAVLLYYRHELDVKQVARALGVTAGTVKTFLFRARNHLRQLTRGTRGRETS